MLGVGVGDKVLRKIRCTLIILDNQHANLAKSSVSSTAGGEQGAKRRLLSLGRCPSRTAIFSCGHGDRTNRAHQGGSRDLELELSRHLKLPRQACTRRRRLQPPPWADRAFKPRLRRRHLARLLFRIGYWNKNGDYHSASFITLYALF